MRPCGMKWPRGIRCLRIVVLMVLPASGVALLLLLDSRHAMSQEMTVAQAILVGLQKVDQHTEHGRIVKTTYPAVRTLKDQRGKPGLRALEEVFSTGTVCHSSAVYCDSTRSAVVWEGRCLAK